MIDKHNNVIANNACVLPLTKWSLILQPNNNQISLPFIDPLFRRRLSSLSKMALAASNECVDNNKSHVRMIFASQHGEIQSSLKMLHDLSNKMQLSPTTFSLSVHNTTVGLYSIARTDRSSSTAISAGEDTLFAALQEAAGQISRYPTEPVLVICADEVLPHELSKYAASTDKSYALALLFDSSSAHKKLKFEWDIRNGERNTLQPAIALVEYLDGRKGQFYWDGPRHTWKITQNE